MNTITRWLMMMVAGATAFSALGQAQPGWVEFKSQLNTWANDSDNDGILDVREALLQTNPNRRDSDDDGFDDLFEDQFREFGFDPLARNVDRDRDGVADELELSLGLSPETPDSDGDGLADLDEIFSAPFGYDPAEPTVDTDFDGLTDAYEMEHGYLADTPDSDGDGLPDFEEVLAGLDPLVASDHDHGELVGQTYSAAMAEAIVSMRKGEPFPPSLARELPFSSVMTRLIGDPATAGGNPTLNVSVSAALMQSSMLMDFIDPYRTFNQIVVELMDIANHYDGAPGPDIARMFFWSEPTFQGRHILALKISDNPHVNEPEREVLYMGVHHARELITSSITLGWIKKLTQGYAAGDTDVVSLVNESEIWVIPVLNPDGFSRAISERQSGANANWRKNLRQLGEFSYPLGVDLNRNYGFEHISSLSSAQIAAMNSTDKYCNGLTSGGTMDLASYQFPGYSPFSEVETRAVRGLVRNQFMGNWEVSQIGCSLSWHSYGGEVIYPMGHPTTNGLAEVDRPKFDLVSDAFAAATGYDNKKDTWPLYHYDVYGGSDDWLYKEEGIFALTIESYAPSEKQMDVDLLGISLSDAPMFYPQTLTVRNHVVNNNIQGAMAFAGACCEPTATLTLSNPNVSAGIFQAEFTGVQGVRYTVEYTTQPGGNDWHILTNTIGAGEPIIIADPMKHNVPARFYRVRQD